jgi:hypothetical protein
VEVVEKEEEEEEDSLRRLLGPCSALAESSTFLTFSFSPSLLIQIKIFL